MVSIKDVAKDAGVSPQTVSNYLNNPSIVKEVTRELVQESIARLKYTPNASARRLRMQKSNTIAIGISPTSTSSVFDRLLHAIVSEADTRDVRVILYKTDSKDEEIRQFAKLTARGDVDSFVLTNTSHDDKRLAWLHRHEQHFVLFGRPWGAADMYDPSIPWVDVDGKHGIESITKDLILHGCKHIAFIGWPGISGTGADRKNGWHNAMLQAKMATEDELAQLYEECENDILAAQTACIRLLDRRPDIDAIVCVSDTIATGVSMTLLNDSTIIVTGYDDTHYAESLGFSSVSQPLAQSAHEILRLTSEANGKGSDANDAASDNLHVLLKPELVIRYER